MISLRSMISYAIFQFVPQGFRTIWRLADSRGPESRVNAFCDACRIPVCDCRMQRLREAEIRPTAGPRFVAKLIVPHAAISRFRRYHFLPWPLLRTPYPAA